MLSATKGRCLYRVVTVILGLFALTGMMLCPVLAQISWAEQTDKDDHASIEERGEEEVPRVPVELTPRESETEDGKVTTEVYVVEQGDTLYEIAKRFGTDVSSIAAANQLNPRDTLHPGDEISVPNKQGFYHRVSSGESLWTIARHYGTTTFKLQVLNELPDPNKLKLGQKLFVPGRMELERGLAFFWPLPSRYKRVSSGFGYRQHPMGGGRNFHTGIDIPAGRGTPIQAAESGRVIQSGRRGLLGLSVEIEHEDGYTTRYGHASRLDVKKGQYVFRGQQLGAVGSTGRSTGPHLHFEIRKKGKALNPSSYLKK